MILASPNTIAHSLKLRFVVITTLSRIVWLRAEGQRWRQVCYRAGVVRSTAWRRWVAALITISKKLDHLDKSKGKAKGAKPLAATTRTTPRETVAKALDNRPDALNFGRDTFLGFEAQKTQDGEGCGTGDQPTRPAPPSNRR